MILDPDGSGVGSRIIGRTERHFATGGRVTARLMSVALVLSLVLCMFWSQSSVDLSRMSGPRNSDPDLSTAPSTEIATGGSPPGKSDSITEYDWPMLQHDLEHSGYSPTNAPEEPFVLWTFQAVDSIMSTPAVGYGMVYFTVGWVGPKVVYAADENTGQLVWMASTSHYVDSTPTLADGRLYAATADGAVYAFDAFNGTPAWIFDEPLPYGWHRHFHSSPMVDVDEGLLYIGGRLRNDDLELRLHELLCINLTSGSLMWNYTGTRGGVHLATPIVTQDTIYTSLGESILAFDRTSHAINWEYLTPKDYVKVAPTLAEDTLFYSEYSAPRLRAIYPSNGSLKWDFYDFDILGTSSTAYHDGLVFLGRKKGNVTAFNATNGEIVWNHVAGSGAFSPPIVADGKVIVFSTDGYLYVLNESSGDLVWRFYVGDMSPNSNGPSIANGKIFIGNDAGMLYAIGGAILPPVNLRTSVVNAAHIRLNWEPPETSFVDYYLIYKSVDRRGFDFSSPVHNTSSDIEPLRTEWIDLNAASAVGELSYVVRAVNEFEMRSTTSNTASKWTRIFHTGLSTFSLPLDPFEDVTVSWLADNISDVAFIRWMDATGRWITHRREMDEGVNDVRVEMGRGYEIYLNSDTMFTFCGYPASMIRFQEGIGDSPNFAGSLSAQRFGSDITLNWAPESGASDYVILAAERRNGLHNLSLSPVATVPSTSRTWTDYGAVSTFHERYYMVFPVDSLGKLGSSTYSIGVINVEYKSGSDTFALPLDSMDIRPLDWYCDAIPNVVGMAYMILQVWKFHIRVMPEGVYDVQIEQGVGYQISVQGSSTSFTFMGY